MLIYKTLYYIVNKFSSKLDRMYLQEYMFKDERGWIFNNGENQELQKKIEENVENYKKTINEPKCFICYYDSTRLSDLLDRKSVV